MTDARRIALDALTRITAENREVEDALMDAGLGRLEGRERGFAYTLVMNSLRWGRAADVLLARYIDTPIPERKHRALWALRLGVVQLKVLDVPPHAAVSTTVDLLKKTKADGSFAGMANAVLKKIAASDATLDAVDALPTWMRARWEHIYGADVLAPMAAMLMREPWLDVTLKDKVNSEWQVAGEHIGTHTLRMASCDVTALAGYNEGAWWVQDVASTLPVQLLGDVKGLCVLDACAAPGGKTAQLCAAGAIVTSLDRSPARLRRLRENMQRLHFTPTIVEADLATWNGVHTNSNPHPNPLPEGEGVSNDTTASSHSEGGHGGGETPPRRYFDAVLLDAPCSASGTLRRHPEIGWMRAEADITRLAQIQAKLMARAWQSLKAGGVMVYSVCSLEPEEGEAQVKTFLAKHADASVMPATLAEGAAPQEAITPEGFVRTLPHHWADKGGMDGFFAVAFRKILRGASEDSPPRTPLTA